MDASSVDVSSYGVSSYGVSSYGGYQSPNNATKALMATSDALAQASNNAFAQAFGTCGMGGWNQKNTDDLARSLLSAGLCCLFLGIMFLAVSATWKCCPISFCKSKLSQQVAGAFFIALGLLLIVIPFLASSSACTPLAQDICWRKNIAGCPCKLMQSPTSPSEFEILKGACGALGFLFAYTAGMGFFGCLFGPIVSGFGCCLLCQCCNSYVKGGHVTGVDEDGKTNDGKTLVAPQKGEPIGANPELVGAPVEVAAACALVPGGRAPPPGAPAGGQWQQEKFCGIVTMVVTAFCCWCAFCCPCDTRPVYVGPDGKTYKEDGCIINTNSMIKF